MVGAYLHVPSLHGLLPALQAPSQAALSSHSSLPHPILPFDAGLWLKSLTAYCLLSGFPSSCQHFSLAFVVLPFLIAVFVLLNANLLFPLSPSPRC